MTGIAMRHREDHPTLTPDGANLLRSLTEHPHAPRFTNHTGSKLLSHEVPQVYDRMRWVESYGPIAALRQPTWLAPFLTHCVREVPQYRRYGLRAADGLRAFPTIARHDLTADIVQFVPDDREIEGMITFVTSGTTGHRLHVPSHPTVAAEYLAYYRRAAKRFGIDLSFSPDTLAIALIGHQQRCFTYVSVLPTEHEAGLVKLNLHPSDWRDPSDRLAYLSALAPTLISGDPLSLHALLELLAQELSREAPIRPRAIVSTAMQLLPGLRTAIATAFDCPVLDVYSLNEVGPVAVFDPLLGGHVLLQPELLVEVLDSEGNPVPDGERGEITVTGGFNPWLPLVRYRTGDFASLQHVETPMGPIGVLMDLEGRAPVRFRHADGTWRNNVDVSQLLGDLPLPQYQLHQFADGACRLTARGRGVHTQEAAFRVRSMLECAVELAFISDDVDKVHQYTTDVLEGLVT